MKRFQWLVANAHQVSIECNQHRCYYETVEKTIGESPQNFNDLTDEERAELIANDSICTVQMYPETPVGFVFFHHWDPEVCVDRAYRWLREKRGLPPDAGPGTEGDE